MSKDNKVMIEKSPKARNHIFLAMVKRNGAGSHEKPHKVQRNQDKVNLKKNLPF